MSDSILIKTNQYNISNLPLMQTTSDPSIYNHIGYQPILIEPTLRQKTTATYSYTAPSNIWYSGKRFNREPVCGILIGILVLAIGLLIITILWFIWRTYIADKN